MFNSREQKKIDPISKAEFDIANRIILNSNRSVGLDTDYLIYEIDLGVAHINYPVGILSDKIIGDSFTVHSAPSNATIRINNSSAPAMTALQGLKREGRIKELYVSNPKGSGTLQIEVVWKETDNFRADELTTSGMGS